MMPFFSIVIPLYNKANFIEATLKSINNQTFKSYEIIIVNDGSTDDSLHKIERFKAPCLKVFTQANKGVANARNFGIAKAKGQYIALLDADDTWHPWHLENLYGLIDTFNNAALFCTNYEVYLSEKVVKPAFFNFDVSTKPFIVPHFFKSSVTNMVAWTSAVAFSKEKFEVIGKFNETLDTYEDIDLWIRFALKYPVAFHPKISMQYKIYISNSLTKTENNLNRLKFLNSFLKYEVENKDLKKYLDINRYALAIRCKLTNEKALYLLAKKQINMKHINLKQRVLLNAPKSVLLILKWLQKQLLKCGIYLTAFK